MRRITNMLFLLLLPLCMQAQNLVPNGNFEYYTACPSSYGQLTLCTGWSPLLNTSPDFFHFCGNTIAGVPNNAPGYQQAASGNGYAATIVTSTQPISGTGYREVITRPITPMTSGFLYEVSFSVSRANNFGCGADNMSVFFFDTIGTVTQANIQSIQPQVSFQHVGVISDTANWVRLTGAFHADSAYDHIAIGGFFPTSVIDIDTYNTSQIGHAYYYIDSVVVKPISILMTIDSYNDTIFCVGDSIKINYTCPTLYPTNVFTTQLSDAFGSFANPTTISVDTSRVAGTISGVIPKTLITGSDYRIRIITSAPTDTTTDIYRTISIGNLDSTIINLSSNSPVCDGGVLNFTNSNISISPTYLWAGPNGFTSTLRNPIINNVNPASAGSYYATINLYTCTKNDTLQVQVNASPAKPIATANTPICEYKNLNLTASTTTTGVSYSWTGPNSFTINQQNPTLSNIPLNIGGNYIVSATKNNCSRYDTVSVTIKDAPDTVTLSSNAPICSNDTLQLSSTTSTGTVSYNWTGPNSFNANTNNTTINNSTTSHSGWYVMTVNNNGCLYVDSVQVAITQTPTTPSITFNSPICVGENLNLTATGPTNATYNWTGANGFSSTLKNPTRTNITVSDSGNYSVIATLNGCTSLAGSTHVSINPTPFVNILSADSICDGETVTFTALPSNAGSNPQYQWFVNAQLQTAIGSSFTTTSLANNDVIYCEMTDNAKCSVPYTDQSNTKQIKVLPWLAPSVSISSNPTGILQPWEYVTFTATAVNAGNTPQYQWKRNGQNIVGALGSTWAANNLNDNDTISVDLISDYKCPQPTTAKSNSITVSVAVGVDNINKISNIILSPNPNNGQFTLSGTISYNGLAQIEVINMLGQTVYKTSTTIQNNRLQQTINLDGIASGLYLLRLNTNGQMEQIKFRVD